jgi:predicted ATP-grasp superfamily ATP-dependent carboligase
MTGGGRRSDRLRSSETGPPRIGAAPSKTPVLVLGSAHTTTLEVVRILGRAGIPQFVVGTDRSFVSRSRWHRRLPRQEHDESGPSALPSLLGRLDEPMVLMPCTDVWVRAIASLEPASAARFPASLAPRETLETLLDKGRLAEAAQRLGVPHPRTVCLTSEDDLATLPDSAFQGAFLKPRDTVAFQRRYGVKALRFETRSRALALYGEAHRAGLRLLLQEYIPGPPTQHYFVDGFMDRTGRVCGWKISRRLRMYPPDFGDGCYGVSIRPDEAAPAMDVVERFLRALSYRGVFDAEFKYDGRDGLFKLLEINVRPYGYIGFAAVLGVDLAGMAYRDALGLPVEPVTTYEVGRHYFNPYADVLREGKVRPWTLARSWVGAYQPLFAWDDPLPAVVVFGHELRRVIRRRMRLRATMAPGG